MDQWSLTTLSWPKSVLVFLLANEFSTGMSSWGGWSSMSQSIGFSGSIRSSRGTYCKPGVTRIETSTTGEFSNLSQRRRPLPKYQRALCVGADGTRQDWVRAELHFDWGTSISFYPLGFLWPLYMILEALECPWLIWCFSSCIPGNCNRN